MPCPSMVLANSDSTSGHVLPRLFDSHTGQSRSMLVGWNGLSDPADDEHECVHCSALLAVLLLIPESFSVGQTSVLCRTSLVNFSACARFLRDDLGARVNSTSSTEIPFSSRLSTQREAVRWFLWHFVCSKKLVLILSRIVQFFPTLLGWPFSGFLMISSRWQSHVAFRSRLTLGTGVPLLLHANYLS